jgi:hypothetical protein
MSHEIRKVALNRIYLDNDNPRHDPIDNESEIINYLLRKENVKPLARHIAEAGSMSPLERLAIVAHPEVKGAYIAAEGNRRICALKLLSDPDKAHSETDKTYFRGLAKKISDIPSSLEAVVFSDMETARPWISLRHEGEQGGVGTKAWDSDQKTRFHAQGGGKSNPNIQALLLKQYAGKKQLLSQKQLQAVSLTTLTRYLSNPVFRDALGLTDNKTLNISVPEDEFDRVIKRFLSDTLDDRSGVNSRTNADARKAYAGTLRAEGIAPSTRGITLYDVSSGPQPSDPKPAEKDQPRKRNNQSPDDRKTVIPKGFSVHIKDKVLKRLYDELRGLEAENFSFAATYLLRAVIEKTATIFLEQRGGGASGRLHQKLDRVAKLLAADGMDDRDLKVLRTMAADRDSRYSPDTIGHFVHGGAVPTRTQSIKLWDSIESVMKTMFEKLD